MNNDTAVKLRDSLLSADITAMDKSIIEEINSILIKRAMLKADMEWNVSLETMERLCIEGVSVRRVEKDGNLGPELIIQKPLEEEEWL